MSTTSQENPVTNPVTSDSGDAELRISVDGIQRMFSSSITPTTIRGCLSGLFLFVGALLPWVTINMSVFGARTSQSAAGTSLGSYGTWVIITGILCAIASFLVSRRNRALGFLAVGAISAIDLIVFASNLNSRAGAAAGYSSMFGGLHVSIGFGMWLSLLGAVGALYLGISEWRRLSRTATVDQT